MSRFTKTAAGPIPARAGEPEVMPTLTDFTGAYPRSRGGTILEHAVKLADMGLSLLARGNL